MVRRGDLREILSVTFAGVFLGVGVPTVALFVFGGAESQANLVKFFFYGIMLFSSILVVDFVRLMQSEGFFSARPDLKYFSRMTFHSPGNTAMYQALKDREPVGSAIADSIKNPFKFIFVSGVFSLIFGALIGISGTFVSGVPSLVEGQITESAQLALAVEPAVLSETMFFFVFLFYSVVGAVGWFLGERLDLEYFWSIVIGKVVAVLTIPLAFVAYHIFRYGTSEQELLGVYLLGLTSSVTQAITDSAIFGYFIHASGNFFKKLADIGTFTNELMVVGTVVIGLFASMVYIYLFDPWNWIRGGDE